MEQAILNFATQFSFEPVIANKQNLKSAKRYVLLGMGGSHLAGDILKNIKPEVPILIHKDYDLPAILPEDIADTLFIASSYSGNTEEVISGLEKAYKNKYNIVCIAVGGKVIAFAQEHELPYIQLPDTGIQPRSALGFSMIALAALMSDKSFEKELKLLSDKIKPDALREDGRNLAQTLSKSIPVVYASDRNNALAYNWKIKFNETGKIPAFYNLFPELNHNEMNGFDVVDSTRDLSKNLYCIFVHDSEDHLQIRKRMDVCKELYTNRGIKVSDVTLAGENRLEKIFNSLILAEWTAYHIALAAGTEPDKVPMIEEFKKKIS